MRRPMCRLNLSVQFLRLPALALAFAFVVVAAIPAGAGPFKVLHSFCKTSFCGDGSLPQAALAIDTAGNLFGTAPRGGHESQGTVFELIRTDPGKFKFSRLYSFCPKLICTTGANPLGSLIIDTMGDLYGTASMGGNSGNGVIFKLSPGGKKGWTYTVLYTFCQGTGCPDGARPATGLTYTGAASGIQYDGMSPLYGTTAGGGANNAGTVFRLALNGAQWSETVLYSFCSEGGAACTDGKFPGNPLIADSSGNLFGTTSLGGGNNFGNSSDGAGVAFELASGNGETWNFILLHQFCAENRCTDGAVPAGSLAVDPAGSVFGTTEFGGSRCPRDTYGCGTIFQIAIGRESSQESVLHSFCRKADCADGAGPVAGVITNVSGDLYGTTYVGGGNDIDENGLGGGTVYKLTNSSFDILHRFCSRAGCFDGEYPDAGLTIDSTGELYGTTRMGGSFGTSTDGGTVFGVVP